jgi:RNA polymerase sigma factor (sigma-70 family)
MKRLRWAKEPTTTGLFQFLYERVKQEQINLPPEEVHKLFLELKSLRLRYEEVIFGSPAIVSHLVTAWRTAGSSAKLAIDYNSFVPGLNGGIRDRVDAVFEAIQVGGDPEELLPQARLSYLLLVSPTVEEIIRQEGLEDIFPILDRMNEIRQIAVKTILQAISEVAFRFVSRRKAQIDFAEQMYADLFQEGAMAAMEATWRYDPENSYRAKWSSFAYSWIQNRIQKHLASRVINPLTRSMTERVGVLARASRNLGPDATPDDLVIEANRLKSETAREFDVSEISESVVAPVFSLEDSSLLSFQEPEQPDAHETQRDVRSVLALTLTDDEFKVLALRWGLNGGVPCSIIATAKELGIPRDRVVELEGIAKEKLKKNKELQEVWEVS